MRCIILYTLAGLLNQREEKKKIKKTLRLRDRENVITLNPDQMSSY